MYGRSEEQRPAAVLNLGRRDGDTPKLQPTMPNSAGNLACRHPASSACARHPQQPRQQHLNTSNTHQEISVQE